MQNKYDVGYGTLDAFKRLAQEEAQATDGNIERLGLKVVKWTRGESVFLVEHPDHYVGHVNEGLGSKNIVADDTAIMLAAVDDIRRTECSWLYDNIAQCTVAMIVNDAITLGALPVTVNMHLAVAKADWFRYEMRNNELVRGWKKACDLARCVWGGGETPALRDLVESDRAIIAGSCDAIVKPKERLIKRNITHGDAIILLNSSGIHANGLTFARDLAKKLPQGYLTPLPDGRTYGETLLDPTHIYVGFVEDCLNAGIDIHYAVNITGHGWRKLMRAPEGFTYIIERLPRYTPDIFDFLAERGGVAERDMYADFNMGAGFALYVPHYHVDPVCELLARGKYRFGGVHAGYIVKGERKVCILPKDIVFVGDELQVR